MDNLCHSLVGAVMSAGGLRRRTGLATVTMVIGANLPDVDALVYFTSDATRGLAFRRGITHGVVAMAVLPIVLTAVMLLAGRILESRPSRRSSRVARVPIRAGQLLLVASLAVWSHPLFDLLNTYGVRLLMPFSARWFYADALFIVDPWVWCALAIGTAASLRRARGVPVGAGTATVMRWAERPARVAMAAVAAYITVMMGTSAAGRLLVERQAAANGSAAARHVMVAPQPLTPFSRSVVRELDASYETGAFTWTIPPRYAASGPTVPKALATGPGRAAARSPAGRRFLIWSRFPFAEARASAGGVQVRLDDARYAAPGLQSWAGVTVMVPDETLGPR